MIRASVSVRGSGVLRKATTLAPGVALAFVVALAATFVSTLHGGPQFLYALFFGIALHYLSQDVKAKPGIEFCARGILRLGVGLLGARITAAQIAGLGWSTALIVIGAVVSTIVCGLLLGRKLGMTRAQSVLAGGAVAICGASAALAISAALPREKGGDRYTLIVVVAVTVLSTAAMVIYPLLAKLLHLPPELAGLFLGGTIHDVAQVVGAGYTLGQDTAAYGIIIKLFRVAMLAVVVVAVSAAFKRERELAQAQQPGGREATRQALVPWFLWLFVLMVIVNSTGTLPPLLQSGMIDFSRACLVIAISALGIKTSFAQLASAGWRPFALLLAETVWIAAFVLVAIAFRRYSAS